MENERISEDLGKPETVANNEPSSSENGVLEPESENSQDKSQSENIHYEDDLAVYTDPSTKYQYIWCKDKNEWILRDTNAYGFEDDTHTYTDAEGVKFFWDKQKKAWFPKLDDEFMARYQLNYGFVDNTELPNEIPPTEEKKIEEVNPALKEKLPPPEPSWFDIDDKHNRSVYVSNLPSDLTEDEFANFMQKCGLIMRDQSSNNMKIKLYTDSESKLFKGDALCTFIRIESVDLALKLLDGSDFKGNKVKVERAKFQMKGTFDPSLKPKKRRKKDKDKLKRMQDKLFDWRPEKMRGERAKHEKVVIVKNLFEPTMFDENVSLILEFQQELRDECAKCGEVKKVIIFDRHPDGVAQINMREHEAADAVVQLLNRRWFGKRRITAETYDGKTKYKIAETDSEITQRLDNWNKFLSDENKNNEVVDKK